MSFLDKFEFLRPADDSGSALLAGRPWRDALLWVLAVMAMSFALRSPEMGEWLSPRFAVDGERLLATHDAYAYLAGAKGYSRYMQDPMSTIIGFMHAVTGIKLGTLGFWMPPLFSGLAAIPLCLLCARLRRVEAGLVAGLLATGCFGFLIRTRFGFYDNDFLTLFFAVGTCAGFALWLLPQCRQWWIPGGEGDDAEPQPLYAALAGALLLGMFVRTYVWVYPSGRPIVLSAFTVAVFLGLLLVRKGGLGGLLLGLAVVFGCFQYGWPAMAGALVLVAVLRTRPEIGREHRTVIALTGAVALAGAAMVYLLPYGIYIYDLVLTYLNPAGAELDAGAAGGLNLPSVIGTVREATKAAPERVINYMAGHWSVFALGCAGFVWAVLRKPVVLVFVPLLGLGIASAWLGTRFTMYGGAAVGLGLGLLAADVAARFVSGKFARWTRLGIQVVLTGAVFFVLTLPLGILRPVPAIPKPLAEAYTELKEVAAPDAVLWQWWDYGYGAQYFAERDSFSDGARHSGDWLYPLGKALSTGSALQSSQILKAFGQSWKEQAERKAEEDAMLYPDAKLQLPGIDPLGPTRGMDAEGVVRFFEDLSVKAKEWPGGIPEQYLALTWDSLRFVGWISHFGNWDPVIGTSNRAKSSRIRGASIDFARGVLAAPGNKTASLEQLIFVDKESNVRRRSWMRFGAPSCVANARTGEVYLMDSRMIDSMMVSMLFSDPALFEPYFTLVVDKSPYARIYRAN